ncbi:MAG: GspH/FimT family pseudopilin [Thiotrichaceae bacterium]|nr:GspH/FimT family pseudopilin [Thiotrichaceae bacterium]
MNKKFNNQGYTLVEVLIVLAITSLLTYIASPTFSSMLNSNRMSTRSNELLAVLNFTRSSAVTHGDSVTLCKKNSTSTNCDNNAEWEDGWIVFYDKNDNGNIDSGETILNVYQGMNKTISLSYTHNRLVYNNEGFSYGYSGTFLLCDSRGNSARKGIIISTNGRPRKANTNELSTCP